MNRLQPLKTYGEHCDNEITGKVETFTAAVECVYLVFDIYQRPTKRVKGEGNGVRITVKVRTPVHKKLSQVLVVDTERTEYFYLLYIDWSKYVKIW